MMSNSKKRAVKVITIVVSILAWLAIWELASRLINFDFIFPGVISTFRKLIELIQTQRFWITVLASLGRIFLGLVLGILLGVILSLICKVLPFTEDFISIGITIAKSTPVASIVMLMWVIIGSSNLPTVIAVMMVTPIIWQNLMNGYAAIDNGLLEVAQIFEFSRFKTFKYVFLPTLLKYLAPAILTSVGLAWKSGIAAEVIAYTKNSIGRYIYNSKATFEGDSLLAWTLVVILISLLLEYTVKLIYRRLSKHES